MNWARAQPIERVAMVLGIISFFAIPLVAAQVINPIIQAKTITAVSVIRSYTEITVPANTAVIPYTKPRGEEDYWICKSEYGYLQIHERDIQIDYLLAPFKVKLAWIMGWGLTQNNQGHLGFCYERVCSFWTLVGGRGGEPPLNYLVMIWGILFICLLILRAGKYEDTISRMGTWAVVFTTFTLAGLANIGLCFLFFIDKVSLFAALPGAAFIMFTMFIVTLRCKRPADERIYHKIAAVIISTVCLTLLGSFLDSGLSLLELIILSSPAGIVYSIVTSLLSRLWF